MRLSYGNRSPQFLDSLDIELKTINNTDNTKKNMVSVVPLNECSIEEFCRLCGSESKNGITIYSPEGNEQCLEQKINYCLRIDISQSDLLPKFVCSTCHSRLDDYHKFAEEVNKVQHTLQILIQMRNFANSHTPSELLETGSIIEEMKRENCAKPDVLLPDNLIHISSGNNINTIHVDNVLDDNLDKSKDIDEFNLCVGNTNSGSQFSKTSLNKIKTKKKKKSCEISDSEESSNTAIDSSDECKEENVYNRLQCDDVKEVQNNLGIKCNQCNIVISFKSQFDSHYQDSYNKIPVYTCSFCNKTIEKYSSFRSHCYRHLTEGRYRCEYCNKGFYLRNLLDVHVAAKHTEVKPFICESCGKGFVTHSALSTHIKSHEGLGKEEFPCKECGKILYTRGGLTSHMNAHKLGRRFMCDLCGQTFTQKVNMQHHVKLHYGERPYTCEKCGKCFAEKSHLNRHYSFHSEKRPFKCSVCSKMYKTERCLKVHNMVHAEARPFVCSYCNKGFLSVTKLKQHCNIHTGERPYKCQYCVRTFTNFPNWLKHTRRRHKVDHKTGLSISVKEPTEKEETIPASHNFTISEHVNSTDVDNRQRTENISLASITSQTFSYSSYLNPVPPSISQVCSDQNLITHVIVPQQHMLPL